MVKNLSIASLAGLSLLGSSVLNELQHYLVLLITLALCGSLFWGLTRWHKSGETALIVPALMLAIVAFFLGNGHIFDNARSYVLSAEAPKPNISKPHMPNQPPQIALLKPPSSSAEFNLTIAWKATDDRGLNSVSAEINLSDEQADGLGFAGNGIFLFEPPRVNISLPTQGTTEVEDISNNDLFSNAWAGFYVDLSLTAEDSDYLSTSTTPVRFLLAEKKFNSPLAKSLVGLRKTLILSPESAFDVANQFSEVLASSTLLGNKSGLMLNLISTKNRLNLALAPEDVVQVVQELWPLILEVENQTQ